MALLQKALAGQGVVGAAPGFDPEPYRVHLQQLAAQQAQQQQQAGAQQAYQAQQQATYQAQQQSASQQQQQHTFFQQQQAGQAQPFGSPLHPQLQPQAFGSPQPLLNPQQLGFGYPPAGGSH